MPLSDATGSAPIGHYLRKDRTSARSRSRKAPIYNQTAPIGHYVWDEIHESTSKKMGNCTDRPRVDTVICHQLDFLPRLWRRGIPCLTAGLSKQKRASAKNKRWLKTIFPLYAQCAPCLRRLWMAVPMASSPARSSAYAMGMGLSNRPPVNGSVVNGVTVLRKTGASVFPS